MIKKFKLNQLALAVVFAAGGTQLAEAQQTASSVRGVVTSDDGSTISGAQIEIINEETGLRKTVLSNSSGQFKLPNLPIGSDYTIVVKKEGFGSQKTEDVSVTLGADADLDISLSQNVTDEVVVVKGAQITNYVALGPSRTFDITDLETKPAINRNLTDIIRIDPRVFVDEGRGTTNSIQCGGQNPRFNSFTLDGVRLNDGFGLNSNGYPTERVPFSFDAIDQISVEVAPFDVEYGGFTACNINSVSKSGSNTVSGSLFYDYTDDSLHGDSLEGDSIEQSSFDEKRYGFAVGFPILKDKLFAHVSYEKEEGVNTFDRGAIGSGAVNEVSVTQAELDEIAQIASDVYLYDAGGIPTSTPNEDEKLLVRVDWNIIETQRLALTYIYNDGNNFTESDSDLNEFEFANHIYERGAELNAYVGTLFSDWTSNFSTETRLSYSELDNRQIPVNGTDFGEIRVELDNVDVYLGADDSRHANDLYYEQLSFSFTGEYDFGDHVLSFGLERDELEVFNLFVQHTETEIRFDGIENFRNGFADAIYYNNAPSSDPLDAAAEWGYEANTLFAQDEFTLFDDLTITAGLRYDWYTSDDVPDENPTFVEDYGFSNSTNLDGEGLLQPRVGARYEFSDNLTLRGGIGLFSGGNPNVWLSNNYSNNNVNQFGQRGRSFCYTPSFRGDCGPEGMEVQRSLFDDDVVYLDIEEGAPEGAGPGWGIPSDLHAAVEAGSGDNFEINYLDPDFKLPSEWKLSFGADYEMDNGLYITADLLFTKGQDTAITLRGDLEQVGTTDDGYPIYDSVREPTFVLTNSSEGNESTVISFSVSKDYDNGIDWSLGYAYTEAKDVQPMTSSVAFSNYQNRAFFDPQEDTLSTSTWEIPHRFTGTFGFERAFFGDLATNFSAFALLQEGSPYSLTQGGNGIYNFNPFLDGDNVLAEGASRNGEGGSWWAKADIRVSQELPGFMDDHSSSVFMTIDNFTNLLNDEWGVLREANFPGNVNAEDLENGDVEAEARIGDASLYEIRLGVKYEF